MLRVRVHRKPAHKIQVHRGRDEGRFINFFSSTHKVLKPYPPIVPRWRDDVLLVNASIYDFQPPHVTSGRVEPPGNPIVMSQPCVRMNDVESVGATGRHLTSFEMMCHDAFNRPGRYVYWRSETVEYCHRFLTEVLGIDGKIITYKEKPWSGGGNAGAAVEVFVRGLEVATLVFMDLREDPNGDIEIEGTRYSHMEMNIVDTGYGLERLAWLSQGTPTVYHALYGDVVDAILEASGKRRLGDEYLEKIVKHLAGRDEYGTSSVREALGSDATEENLHLYKYTKDAFIVADHARTLFFMFSDYVIPSNTKVGYLARLLIRRSLRALEELGCKLQLFDIVKMQAMKFSTIVANFPEGFVRVVLEREAERYRETVRSGTNEVRRLISRGGKGIGQEDLITLYDSHGIPPELVQAIAEENGVKVTVPENFTLMVLKRHEVKPGWRRGGRITLT
ncbi:hypothetical protein [Thermogymnomonas acidicola]|uniref:alanine--tRNA ligase-related protein n=1 Tax=Thermogymnomonas acidicola TaxID=399579 RepID=UPI00094629F6|nr:alanine--tRNA ligase-related protein [Thermogymnomonas acidicola]